ncbi:MAG TPA: N-formylglutamate amidohydrolase [Dongiaceae bacterium]|jgi:N-formylglutamate amidohydrolase|nr:N-formylglutamate amidohydrolase [Dongiaceae bacterium]
MSNTNALREEAPAEPLAETAPAETFEVVRPAKLVTPLVVASPHSGNDYSRSFLDLAKLDHATLRLSEDCYVDELVGTAPGHGVPLLKALFPRTYVDANREALELDPQMFEDALPAGAVTDSPRVAAGLGSIPRLAANDREIYGAKLPFAEAERRLETCYRPYHKALAALIAENRERFGGCLLIDCHSMPSVGGHGERDAGRNRVDFVLGDCFGASCSESVTAAVERCLRAEGANVRRNNPYSGGYVTQHYGRPTEGIQVLQIEINRSIYMDEQTLERLPHFRETARRMDRLIALLAREAPVLIRRR